MSPLDITQYPIEPRQHYFANHGWVEVQRNALDLWLAVCHGSEYDEDDVPRSCGWEGPLRMSVEEAQDDAIGHHHDKEGHCLWCARCRQGWKL